MTDFAISQFAIENDTTKVIFRLQQGSMHSVIQPERRMKANFEIVTPTSAVGVRGTVFTVRYDPDLETTTLSVEEGDVSFSDTNRENELIVHAGESYDMDSQGQPRKLKDIDTAKILKIGGIIFGAITIPLLALVVILFKKKKKVFGCLVSVLLGILVIVGVILAIGVVLV